MRPATSRTAAAALAALLALAGACASDPAPGGTGTDGDADGDGDGDADGDGDSDGDADVPGGCDGGTGDAAQPFGNHAAPYADGVLAPGVGTQEERDEAVALFYDQWKGLFLEAGCGDDRYYVATGMDDALTVSEAIGYGMIVEAYMAGYDPDARAQFDGLFLFYRDHPSSIAGELMAWRQEYDCASSADDNAAADGDLDAAYALLLADKQWGSAGAIDYFGEAVTILQAIADHEIDDAGGWVLLGDWVTADEPEYYAATRSSDFMPGHLASFEAVLGDGWFGGVGDSGYAILDALQAGFAAATGLIPDFIVDPGGAPEPAGAGFLEGAYDGEYGFNACRVPLRVGAHLLTSGDDRARELLLRIDDWVKVAAGGNVEGLASGYWLDGDVLPGADYPSMAFTAPFAVAAMADPGGQDWLDALWNEVAYSEIDGEYYGDTLRLLSLIALSGNWWAPEAAPCP